MKIDVICLCVKKDASSDGIDILQNCYVSLEREREGYERNKDKTEK